MRFGPVAAAAALSTLALVQEALAVRAVVIDPRPPEQVIAAKLSEGDFAGAQLLVDELLTRKPDDPAVLYNAACVYCHLDEPDTAASFLLDAVGAGFDNFIFLRRDPDLDSIRSHPVYRAILEARIIADRMLGGLALNQWQRHDAAGAYRYETDEQRHLYYATTLDEPTLEAIRHMLDQQADQLASTLFGPRPPDFALIAVPTEQDAALLLPNPNVDGTYQHCRRRLVARDTGRALRHEFTHLLHHAHMDALNQNHPLWIQEGLATLYENYELSGDGAIHFLPNDRQAVVRHMASRDRLMSWPKLLTLTDGEFDAQSARLYPQTRSMMEFIAGRGLLTAWYSTYVERFDEDPTGALALSTVFGEPIQEIETQWRHWVDAQPLIVGAPGNSPAPASAPAPAPGVCPSPAADSASAPALGSIINTEFKPLGDSASGLFIRPEPSAALQSIDDATNGGEGS